MSEEAGVMGLPPGSNMFGYSRSPRLCGAGRSAVELSALYPSAPPGVDGAGGPRGAVRRAGISEPAGSASAAGAVRWGRRRQRAKCPLLDSPRARFSPAPTPRGEGGSARLPLRAGWQRSVREKWGFGLSALPRVKPPLLAACGALITLSDG